MKRLTRTARIPTRGSQEAAGLDLRADGSYIVTPHAVTPVRTGLAVRPPPGTYVRICSRSGLLKKYGVEAITEVIDGNYDREVIVFLKSQKITHVVWPGDRIGQLICEKHEVLNPVDVNRREAG